MTRGGNKIWPAPKVARAHDEAVRANKKLPHHKALLFKFERLGPERPPGLMARGRAEMIDRALEMRARRDLTELACRAFIRIVVSGDWETGVVTWENTEWCDKLNLPKRERRRRNKKDERPKTDRMPEQLRRALGELVAARLAARRHFKACSEELAEASRAWRQGLMTTRRLVWDGKSFDNAVGGYVRRRHPHPLKNEGVPHPLKSEGVRTPSKAEGCAPPQRGGGLPHPDLRDQGLRDHSSLKNEKIDLPLRLTKRGGPTEKAADAPSARGGVLTATPGDVESALPTRHSSAGATTQTAHVSPTPITQAGDAFGEQSSVPTSATPARPLTAAVRRALEDIVDSIPEAIAKRLRCDRKVLGPTLFAQFTRGGFSVHELRCAVAGLMYGAGEVLDFHKQPNPFGTVFKKPQNVNVCIAEGRAHVDAEPESELSDGAEATVKHASQTRMRAVDEHPEPPPIEELRREVEGLPLASPPPSRVQTQRSFVAARTRQAERVARNGGGE